MMKLNKLILKRPKKSWPTLTFETNDSSYEPKTNLIEGKS